MQRKQVNRRDWLRGTATAGATGSMLGWAHLAQATEQLKQSGRRCILLWMQGGPSQFETFDPKPGRNTGGEIGTTATNVPGIHYSANFGDLAQQAHRLCVIRSMSSREGSHPRAQTLMHTGFLPGGGIRYPSLGSHVANQLENETVELPGFVRIGSVRDSTDGGFLGVRYDPLQVSDPKQPPANTKLPVHDQRYTRRLDLLSRLQEDFSQTGGNTEVNNHRALIRSAATMIRSPQMHAFELKDEPAATQQRYGDSDFAQGCLLARRLVETGVPFVEVQLDGWDTHDDNFNRTKELCGEVGRPMAALLDDLAASGMLDSTLVVWAGEFGRTPRINPRGGRDHYPKAYSLALAGCGVQGGQVIGATDADGLVVKERPVSVGDLFHTLYHALGLDPNFEHHTAGRPVKLADKGSVVQEVFGA